MIKLDTEPEVVLDDLVLGKRLSIIVNIELLRDAIAYDGRDEAALILGNELIELLENRNSLEDKFVSITPKVDDVNELRSHTDVENLRQKVTQTYAWDFIFSGGDAIKEKYQCLHDIVSTSCLRENDSKEVALVVASKSNSSFLLVFHEFDEVTYKDEKRDDITFVGEFRRSCGSNGYKTDFHFYQDDKIGDDEIIVVKGNKVSVVKLFNHLV